MSKNLTTNQVAKFNDQVHHAYDASGNLRDSIRVVTGVSANTYQFQKMGIGQMIQRTPQTPVLPANIAHTNAIATLQDWYIAEYSDKFDQNRVNYQETSHLAAMFGRTGGRRVDQQIIDALEAASTTLTVANTIGSTTALDSAKLRRAKQLLDTGNVMDGDRTCALSTRGLEQMLGDSDANTIDRNVIKTLVDGDMNYWLGFTFRKIGTRVEGGLPLSGIDRTTFCYHNSAAGIAIGQDPRTMIDWVPQYTSHLVQSHYIGGAVAIDALGIVEVFTEEA